MGLKMSSTTLEAILSRQLCVNTNEPQTSCSINLMPWDYRTSVKSDESPEKSAPTSVASGLLW